MSASVTEQIGKLMREATAQEGPSCDLEFDGAEMLLTANRAALFHLADRIIKLASAGVSGSHFTVDRADIAPNATHSLTVSLG